MSIFEILFFIILYLFYLRIVIVCQNYILRSLWFIKPMKQKYQIMINDSNNINGRFPYILIASIIILLFLYLLYKINMIIFIISLIIIVVYAIYLYQKFSKFTILNYINEFSADLFDWHKIYELLSINNETKINCFKIHNIDYNEFHEEHKIYLEKQIRKYKAQLFDVNKKITKD